MSKADEMFKELGYINGTGENLGNKYNYIYYEKSFNRIMFYYKQTKEIRIDGNFSIQEIQAINKKCEELRLVR